MTAENPDPEEYTPEGATTQEEYEPAPVEVGTVGEADPADVADQSAEVPIDEPGPGGDDDYDDNSVD